MTGSVGDSDSTYAGFIVLEGPDGIGKSTQVAMLGDWLESEGIPYLNTREPGGSLVGEAVRSVVLSKQDIEMPAETELFLLCASRAAYVQDVVRPALEEGLLVLSDRFFESTLAYQGFGRWHGNADRLAEIMFVTNMVTRGLIPDRTIVLKGQRKARAIAKSADAKDRIEKAGREFFDRVVQGYDYVARELSDHVVTVDANGSAQEVHERIRPLVSEIYEANLARRR